MLLSGTDCPAATVWLVAVTTGAGIPGSVIVTSEVLLQTPRSEESRVGKVPGVSARTKARHERLETVSHRSAAIGVPLLVTVPSAGSPTSGQLNQIRYAVTPLPLTE